MFDYDEEQRALLERETIDFTVKVPVRDLIDLAAEEAFPPDGELSIREIAPVDVWSYLGPAAALTALKEHGWMFDGHHLGREWIEAALEQCEDDKFAKPIIEAIYDARRRPSGRHGPAAAAEPEIPISNTSGEAPGRTLAFLELESVLRLDMLEDEAIVENAKAVAEAACSAANTLSQEEKEGLRYALVHARPLVNKLNFDGDDLQMLLAHFSKGLTRRTHQLFRAATQNCHPSIGWMDISGLDMIGELLDETPVIGQAA